MTALNFPATPSDGDTFENYVYDSTDGVWKRIASGIELNGISDVNVTSATTDQLLRWSGTEWINGTANTNSIADDAITAAKLADTAGAVMVFADGTSRTSAIPSPSEGMVTYRSDDDVVEVFDGSAFVPVIPDPGLEFITSEAFTDVASVSLDNCFTSDYANYRLIVRITTILGTAAVGYRFRASGSDDTASNYRYATSTHAGTPFTNSRTLDVSSGVFTTVSGSANYDIVQDIFAPQLAENTGTSGTFSTRGTLVTLAQTGFSAATSFDGISIIPTTGNITGKIYVYGYREA